LLQAANCASVNMHFAQEFPLRKKAQPFDWAFPSCPLFALKA